MHMVIHALVDASNRNDALDRATTVFDRLVGLRVDDTPVFDYYVTFDEEGTTAAGKVRWGELPTAVPVDSADGQHLLERGWRATEQEFHLNYERVREAFNELSEEEFMHEEMVRHACANLGAYDGPPVYIYDESAAGIRTRSRLDDLLDESDELWIVPADVHY